MPLIAPSLLSADFSNLERDIRMVNGSVADWFHLDVMDGVFVPNISFGMPVIRAVKTHARKPLDVHLMIVDPGRYVKEFGKAGADILSVHAEACTHLHRTVQSIRQEGMKAGVAINPHTPVDVLQHVIGDLDVVCLMSVNPGFGGQKFIEDTYAKLTALRSLIRSAGSKALVEIDGGVGPDNAKRLTELGAGVLVAGNSVFAAKDPAGVMEGMKKL